MKKNIIFLVHGVGKHKQGWSQKVNGPISAIKESTKVYDSIEEEDIDKNIDFIEICYDDIFERQLDQWEELTKSIRKSGVVRLNILLDKVTVLISKITKDTFLRTHGGDAILYAFFPVVARIVRLRVIHKIISTIETTLKNVKDGEPLPFIGIIAHSLGTAVIHDSLHQLGNNDWLRNEKEEEKFGDLGGFQKEYLKSFIDKNGGALFHPSTGVFKVNMLMMLSNTSRLFRSIMQSPYNPAEQNCSLVKPGPFDSNAAMVRDYINVDHQFDPISKVKPFQMPHSWQVGDTGGIDIKVNHIFHPNIHGFDHYLLHPAVYDQIFYRLFDVSEKDFDKINKEISSAKEGGGRFRKYKMNSDFVSHLKEILNKDGNQEEEGQVMKWQGIYSHFIDYLST